MKTQVSCNPFTQIFDANQSLGSSVTEKVYTDIACPRERRSTFASKQVSCTKFRHWSCGAKNHLRAISFIAVGGSHATIEHLVLRQIFPFW